MGLKTLIVIWSLREKKQTVDYITSWVIIPDDNDNAPLSAVRFINTKLWIIKENKQRKKKIIVIISLFYNYKSKGRGEVVLSIYECQ